MVTKEQAVAATYGQVFHHVKWKNADGTPFRVRVSGKCKTWKTRPNEFKLPIKHGLYDSGYLTQDNAHEFVIPGDDLPPPHGCGHMQQRGAA